MRKLSREQQIAFMAELKDMYLDHMEGEDSEGFEYWENLYCAANLIWKAMQEGEK